MGVYSDLGSVLTSVCWESRCRSFLMIALSANTTPVVRRSTIHKNNLLSLISGILIFNFSVQL